MATGTALFHPPLTARRAGPADMEAVRAIRNAGVRWMTRDTKPTDAAAQRAWFAALPPDWKLWVYERDRQVVAYGLRRPDGERVVGTLAVRPDSQGRGIGRAVLLHLRAAGPEPLWLEVRPENLPCLGAALAAGFVIIRARGRLVTLHAPAIAAAAPQRGTTRMDRWAARAADEAADALPAEGDR